MHSLLTRQLRRFWPAGTPLPAELEPLLGAIDEAYAQADADRALLERALDLNSKDLVRRHDALQAEVAEHQRDAESLRQHVFAMNAAIDGVGITDSTGHLVYVNSAHARMFGYGSPAELVGRPWRIFFDEGNLGRLVEIGPALRQDGRWRGEATGRRVDGSHFPVELSLSVIDGCRTVCVIRDVADRKQLERQFLHSQKMEAVGRLAGGIAHDFNNILTAILGCSEFLLEDLPIDSPNRIEAVEIRHAADRGAALTRQLLGFARHQVLVASIVDVNELTLGLSSLLRRLLDSRIEVVIIPCAEPCAVRLDPSQFEQILVNLAVNARDAMPDRGKLTIQVQKLEVRSADPIRFPGMPPGKYALLVVTDTGYGMTDDVRSHAFEPFFTTKPAGQGTGLGLATTYGIVKQSGGFIWLDSAPDRGTSFRIALPLCSELGALRHQSQAPTMEPGGDESILVVEDDASVRAMIARALRLRGYCVYEADNGDQGLRIALLRAAELSLVITDLVMPHFTGKELVDALASRDLRIPVLCMSGYTDTMVLDPRIPFLAKPFAPAVLLRTVRDIIDRSAGGPTSRGRRAATLAEHPG